MSFIFSLDWAFPLPVFLVVMENSRSFFPVTYHAVSMRLT